MRAFILTLYFLSACYLRSWAGEPDSLRYKKVIAIVDSVRRQFAPDKRTAVFNARFSEDSSLLHVETTIPASLPALRTALQQEQVRIVESLLPQAGLRQYPYGITTLSTSNNRLHPFNAAEMVTQMLMGTPVEVLKEERGYYLVRTPDQYISWVDRYAVVLVDSASFHAYRLATKIIYTADYGHAYATPSHNAARVSDLVKGNIIALLGKKKRFYHVQYADGREAYIDRKEALLYDQWLPDKDPVAAQLLQTAYTFIGVPYLWGGASGKGLDCSGFTRTCYFLNGIILPRDASQQALAGEDIDITEGDSLSLSKCLAHLQPGDLLFFSNARTGNKQPGKITHTAMYTGNGNFIQSAGLVRINSIVPGAANYDDFQSRTLVSARRILTVIGDTGIVRVSEHPLYNNQRN